MIGSDFQIFNPTNDADQYFTVHSSRTLMAGQLNVGFFLDAALNSLPVIENDETGSNRRTSYDDVLISTVFQAGLGIMKGWDIGLSLPFASQTVDSEPGMIGFQADGLTELRLNTKYRLIGGAKKGVAVIATLSRDQIKTNPYNGRESGDSLFEVVNYQFEVAGNYAFNSKFDGALNLGYRPRNPGPTYYPDFPTDPVNDQITASMAFGWNYNKRWRFIAEVYSAITTKPFRTDAVGSQNPAEIVAGAKYRLMPYLYLYSGMGTEIVQATFTPGLRAFVGINWSPLFAGKKLAVKQRVVKKKPRKKRRPPLPPPAPPLPPEPPEPPSPPPSPPEPVVPIAEVPNQKFVLEKIYFESGSFSNLIAGSMEEVGRLANYLKSIPFEKLTIEGHTDSVGDDTFNLQLSKDRAATIKVILVEKYGIPRSKISTTGYGKNKPIDSNYTPQGRQKNRRVEFSIFMDRK